MYTHKYSLILSLAIIFFAVLVAGFIVVMPLHAQEDTIIFPVAELGNCESKEECHSYCDEPGNMSQCIAFAKANGLMTEEEAEAAEKFSDSFEEGEGGPGGCTTPSGCEAYCEDITHLNECLLFAEEYGHEDEFVEEGRKIAQYLEGGGQMPGGCTTKQSCELYCSDFNNGEECLLFAEQAGLEVHDDDDFEERGPSLEQMRTMIELMRRGETPGGCTSEQSCETYCSDSANAMECVAFGEKVGFISSEEAEIARKTGGKGPGGCSSPVECDRFCNNPDNREQCFAFAKEHGLIGEEEIRELEQGTQRLKEALANAPEEARKCLQENLGSDIISDINAGTVSPGPEFARKIEACMHKGFEEQGRREFENMLRSTPPEVLSCIEDKVGDIREMFGVRDNEDLEQVVKGCFESFRPPFDEEFEGEFHEEFEDFDDSIFHRTDEADVFRHDPNFRPDFQTDFRGDSQGGFNSAGFLVLPPEMERCAIDMFGGDFRDRLASGELNDEDFKRSLDDCIGSQYGDQFQNEIEEGFRRGFKDNSDRVFIDDFERKIDCSLIECLPGSYCDPYRGCVVDDFKSYEQPYDCSVMFCEEGSYCDSYKGCVKDDFVEDYPYDCSVISCPNGQVCSPYNGCLSSEERDRELKANSSENYQYPPGPGDPGYVDNTATYDCSQLNCGPSPNYCDPWNGCQIGTDGSNPDGSSCDVGYEWDGTGCIPWGTGNYDFPSSDEGNFESEFQSFTPDQHEFQSFVEPTHDGSAPPPQDSTFDAARNVIEEPQEQPTINNFLGNVLTAFGVLLR